MAVSLLQLLGNVGQPAPASPLLQGTTEGVPSLLGEDVVALPFSFSEVMAQYKTVTLPALLANAKQPATTDVAGVVTTQTPVAGEGSTNADEGDYFYALFVSFTQTIITTSPEIAEKLTLGAMPAVSSQEPSFTQGMQEALAEMNALWQDQYGEALPLSEGGVVAYQQITVAALVFAPILSQAAVEPNKEVALPALEDVQPEDIQAAYAEMPIIPQELPYDVAIGQESDVALQGVEAQPLEANIPTLNRYIAPPPARMSPLFYGQAQSAFTPENTPLSLPIVAGLPVQHEGVDAQPTLSSLMVTSTQAQEGAALAAISSVNQAMQRNDAPLFALPAVASMMTELADGNVDNFLSEGGVDAASSSTIEELSSSVAQKEISTTRFIAQEQASARFTPYEQMAVHIKQLHNNKKGQVTVQLHPAELGRVDIRVGTQEDGSLLVRVMTELRDTYDLLRNDKLTLERILQDSGLQMQHGSLEFSHREQGNGAFEAFAENLASENNAGGARAASGEEPLAQLDSDDYTSLAWVATTGINIRV